MNKVLICLMIAGVTGGCTAESPYRDTSELEIPPVMDVQDMPVSRSSSVVEKKPEQKSFVSLDDSQSPPVIMIEKLLDRSWELVGQALNDKQIKIIDKNREDWVYRVKYDATKDSGEYFGNVHFLGFEDEYGEAEYEVKLSWNGTETEVHVRLLKQAETDDEDEELADGSEKLVQTIYQAVKAIVNPEEKEQ